MINNPSHEYANDDVYPVVLAVADNGGARDTCRHLVAVGNQPPTAEFTYAIDGLLVDFEDSSEDSDGVIVSWHWDFGDGGESSEQSPSHEYPGPDEYEVGLTVTDDGGLTDTTWQTVLLIPDVLVYSDSGIVADADIWLWGGDDWGGPPGEFDPEFPDPTAPEGSESFRTRSGEDWSGHTNYAGWGVFMVHPNDHTIDISAYARLRFWVKTAVDLKVELQENSRSGTKSSVRVSDYGWNVDSSSYWQRIEVPGEAFSGVDLDKVFCPFMVTVEKGDTTFFADHVRWTQ